MVSEDGEQIGIVTLEEALARAEEVGFDLIEVSPHDDPPVCKIEDHGKLIYKQKKLEKKHKAKQKGNEVKGVRLSVAISDHDFNVKVEQAKRFMHSLHPVKVSITLKGREIAQRSFALDKLKLFAETLQDLSQIESSPKMQGANAFMILIPKKN